MTDIVKVDSTFTENPLDILRRLQTHAPVSRAEMWGGVPVWLITRHADAKRLLTDPRLSKDHARAVKLFPPENNGNYVNGPLANMLNSDPPDHTRLRKLVVKAFTAKSVEQMRSRIESIADELLDAIDTDVSVDLIKAYAGPLPVRVISELLGIPEEYQAGFIAMVDVFVNEASAEQTKRAAAELSAILTELITDKREHPSEDLISALIAAGDDGERLTEAELTATIFLLIAAGYDTTVNLIANGMLALLRNPTQLAALRADPLLMPGAIEEFLRFDSPVNIATLRFTTEPICVEDVEIPADQFVMISLLAANHDAAAFDNPDELQITRKPNSHLAFGYGIHHCVGAALGRLEGRVALSRLLARFDRIELATDQPIRYRNSALMHGLTELPIRCDANYSDQTIRSSG
ncbi:MAG: cytochrome P450 [Mycobacterium sp.]